MLQRIAHRWRRPASGLLLALAALATVATLLGVRQRWPLPPPPPAGPPEPFRYRQWPGFSLPPPDADVWYNASCLDGRLRPDLALLGDQVRLLRAAPAARCRRLADLMDLLFTLEYREARVPLPGPLRKKVLGWMAGSERLLAAVEHQRILHVTNNLEVREAAFNPGRARRPQPRGAGPPPRDQLQQLAEASRAGCDFCHYRDMTAPADADETERMASPRAVVVGNTFKLDGAHALVLSREHNPLNLTGDDIVGMLKLAERWCHAQQARHPELRFPSLVWDVGLHAGMSQTHPHLHVMLSPGHYMGGYERLRRAAHQFAARRPGDNYFSALVRAHAALGLAVRLGAAVAFAALDPLLDMELWVVSAEPGADWRRLYALAVHTLQRRLGRFCHSSGLALPALGEPAGRLPALARLVSRGDCTAVRADVSSLELFAVSSISADPYDVIRELRAAVEAESR